MANILNIYDRTTGKYVGIPSIKGESAYEIAVKHGYEGTEEEWVSGLNAGESVTYYKYAVETPSYNDNYFKTKVKTDFDLPTLPTYNGGTRFYCQPVPIIEGEIDFYNEMTVLAGEKEYGYETDDTYKSQGKLYVNHSYEGFNEDLPADENTYAEVYNTTTGTLDDYLIRGVLREKRRENELATILFRTDSDGVHYELVDSEWDMCGNVDYTASVWLYPVEYFEPKVNGVYQPVDISILESDKYLKMALVTEEMVVQMRNGKTPYLYGLCTHIDKWSSIKDSSVQNNDFLQRINTAGYTTDSYVMVLDEETDDYLDPMVVFKIHSDAYDYLKYKVWTTNKEGTESSTKYTINLSNPLRYGEYIRYNSDPLYIKKSKALYKKSEALNVNGKERFTGEYDEELNPIFQKTLHLPALSKPTSTTINRMTNYVDHNIVGLKKFVEIVPTWHRTNDMTYIAYTGNCFALDHDIKNHGVYPVTQNGNDSTYLSRSYLQVYPSEKTIIADRGCNVWCYDCDVVLKYTRELTQEDYDKYKF